MKKALRFRPIYPAALVFVFSLIFVIEAFAATSLNYVFDFVGYGGTFKNHDLKLLGLPAYWVLMLAGLGICLIVSFKKREKYGLRKLEAALIPLLFFVTAFVGGKLLYMLEHIGSGAKLGFDGLSLFGAIFLTPFVSYCASGFKLKRTALLLDLCAGFGLILLAAVRFGCFIEGCCEAQTFFYKNYVPIILPVQLFEVTLDLILLDICFEIEHRQKNHGYLYPILLTGYGAYRFLLEFLRKTEKTIVGFSYGQIYALASVLLGITALLLIRKYTLKKNH